MPAHSPRDIPDLETLLHTLEHGREFRLPWAANHDFPGFLKHHRNRRGLSLRQVADRVGVSHATLYQLEEDTRAKPPPLELLGKLAEVFGFSLGELMSQAGYFVEIVGEESTTPAEDLDARFEAAVSHPLLASRHAEALLDYTPQALKPVWLEIMTKLVALGESGELKPEDFPVPRRSRVITIGGSEPKAPPGPPLEAEE
jgi:transcriptional regulator with XRE-family HTH domain